MQDVFFALRQLRKTPGFTLTVLLTLALGIGANAAIFTLVHTVLLKNLPVADPKMLIRLGDSSECCVSGGSRHDGNYSLFSTATYELLKKSAPEFEELAGIQAGFAYRPIIVRRDKTETEARSVMGEFVSGNYFRTFGLQPHAGRLFTDADDKTGAPMTAILSYEAWQRDYAGDPSVVGSTFWVNTRPVTIVGVAPQGFYGDRMTSTPPDFFLPIFTMPLLANAPYVNKPASRWLYMIGRVKPGVALGPLQQKLSALIRQSMATQKDFGTEQGKAELARAHVTLTPGGAGIQAMQEQYSSQLRLLMWVSGLVLLIACANIANLLLVRGMNRRAEMSIRSALGAMRSRIIRQLLTESILLSTLGGVAGLMVAYAGTRMLLSLTFPGAQEVPIHAEPSFAVIGFAFGLSLLTGILFGVAPAWITAQSNPADALRTGTRTTTGGVSLLQRSLVVFQASLSLVLLVGAGLFSQSLNKLQNTDMKLQSKNRYIVHINPQAAGYSGMQLEALYRTMEQRFHAVPGVVKTGLATYTPMEDNNWGNGIVAQGEPKHVVSASFVKVNGDYFDSVGTRVLLGRGVTEQDTSTGNPVTVINQTLANQLLKGQNPIGHHLGFADAGGTDYEIVGVVDDTVYQSVRWKDHGMYFVPVMQRPLNAKGPIDEDMSLYVGALVIQTDRPMNDMEAIARKTLGAINPNLTIVKFQTFDAQIADNFIQERTLARLTMLFGALALMLATIGIYGVTAYNVVRRTPEIGIRMALGAERTGVIAMVMKTAFLQTAVGLVIGIPIALLCVRFVKSQLYEITSANTTVMLGAILALAVAGCVAAILPASRAANTDPVQALRME